MWEPIITFFLLSIAIIIFIIRYISMPVYMKYIAILLIAHLVFYSYTAYMMYKDLNNMILFHVLRPFQYALTSFFFIELFKEKKTKVFILISIPLFLFYSYYFSFFIQGITQYNSYSILLNNLLVTVAVLFYYRELLLNKSVENLLVFPAFWVTIGLLFYCVGTTFSEGLMNYLILKHRKYSLSFYNIGIVLSFFLYLFIITGLLCDLIFSKGKKIG